MGIAAMGLAAMGIPAMRFQALATLAIGAALVAAAAQAQTFGSKHPVCLHVFGPNSYLDCRYNSIAQCNQSASGRAAQCETNPYMANAADDGLQISKRFRPRLLKPISRA